MEKFEEKYGPWALVTGAGAGIGAEFASQLAALGLHLVLVDRRQDPLDRIVKKITDDYSVDVKSIKKDLEEPDFLHDILQITDSLQVGLLVNNAGYALTGDLLDHDLEQELGLLYVNCRAPLILSHEYGRRMVKRGRGGIIFLSSIAAFLPMPFWTHYSASKVYDLHMANGLYLELKDKGVDVLALCPGNTKTDFADVAGIRSVGMNPEPVVSHALKKLGKKPLVVPGIGNRFITFSTRMMSQLGNIKIGARVVQDLRRVEPAK
jgi:short-subunit dehydrogenase